MAESGQGALRQSRMFLGSLREGQQWLGDPMNREAHRQNQNWSGGTQAGPEMVGNPFGRT